MIFCDFHGSVVYVGKACWCMYIYIPTRFSAISESAGGHCSRFSCISPDFGDFYAFWVNSGFFLGLLGDF